MIVAAADGSSLNNPGPAGWAWFIDKDNWACGGWPHGTNNRGELMALLQLLTATAGAPDEPLKVLCDSQYVINSVTKWMAGWKRRGWVKADKKPVQNVELLKAIDQAITGRTVSFEWVKGHAGHPLNEAADTLAHGAATAYQQGKLPDPGPGFRGSGPVGVPGEPARGNASGPARGDASEAARGRVAPEPASTREHRSVLGAPSPTVDPDAEPDLFSIADDPADDFAEVVRAEQSLLTDEVRSDPARLRVLLHPDFVEYAASGRIWTRARLMAQIGPLPRRVTFEVMGQTRLSADTVLLRWKAIDSASTSLRSSIWVRDGTLGRPRWRLLFAQGTVQAPGAPRT